ncbi:hypothetical protein DFS34DRAFT_456843 [Phlyctochytrium arcticum]|nr:hypothetical protein DFS34DRAFT_456843 [Phlyctochytrium arcticum]
MGSSPSVTTSAPGPTLAPTGNTELEPPAVVVDPQTQAADIQQQQPAPAAESNDSPAAPTVKPMVLAKEDRPVDRVFQNIVNFRDVGKNYNSDSGTNRLREGWFFRSGRLDDASTVDLELLTETFGIKVVVDLRSETEGKMGDGLVNTFPASVINEVNN